MDLIETPTLKEVRILKEILRSALFKLQSNTEEICALTSLKDKKKCYVLFNENKEKANTTINKLKNYLDQVDAEIPSLISHYALEHLYNAQLTTGRSIELKGSSKGSSKCSSEKDSLALLQNESRAKRNLKLLGAPQKLERAQTEEDYLRVEEIGELTQASDVSVNNEVLRYLETLGQINNTYAEFVNRPITSCMIAPIQNFDQNNI